MKQYLTYLFSILFSISAIGQIQFHGLYSNPNLEPSKSYKAIQTSDTLELPFFDDFSYDTPSPSADLWLDRHVFINDNFANLPPSIGVATFDILDENGLIYDTAETSAFVADYLTSKPINLSKFEIKDSLIISFYYQPQGNGWDSPDQRDSLVLQFRTSQKEWHSVWSTKGTSLKAFEQVLIPITDASYLQKDFQFRFYNYASIGGSQNQEDAITNDFWNLDYILLDTNRSVNNPYHKDVAFYTRNTSLLYDYFSVPWEHYRLSSMRIDSVDYNLNNLSDETLPYNHLNYLLYQNISLKLDSFDNGGGNISAMSVKDHLFSQKDMSGNSSTNNIPITLSDSTSLSVVRYFALSDTLYAHNDTAKYTQYFYNYYAYDDGSAEAGLSLIGYEAKFAFLINALKNDTLRGLSIFFNRYKDYGTADEAVFSLCVWKNDDGKPGKLLYKEDNIKPRYTKGKNAFSTYKFKKGILVEKSFFVGWINDTKKVYSLGYDFNNNNDHQVFYQITDSWDELSKGTPMIRPLMGSDFVYLSNATITKPSSIKIYPNPTHNQIKIDVKDQQDYRLQLFNITGKCLIDEMIREGKTISLKAFGSGLYIVKISNNESSVSKKIIVL